MERFCEDLVAAGLVSPSDLDRARAVAEQSRRRLPATLVGLGIVSEADLVQSFARAEALPIAPRALLAAAPLTSELNPRFCARHALLGVEGDQGERICVMADPGDADARDGVAFACGATIDDVMVASFSDVQETIATRYRNEADAAPAAETLATVEELERLFEGDSEAPVIRLVQRLLATAVNRRASDVHIEPMGRRVAIRYRIDGRLVEVEQQPLELGGPIASRIKVMAGLDIAESRLPQDGRLRLVVRGRDVDVRVSTSPTAHGESIVMRLLGRSEVPLELDRLGLPPAALTKLERALERPHGIILLTGPTGSGKTTTLYAAINRLSRPDVKILTVEDPVEVLLDGVNQVQVRPEIELSYAATLRAFLRQDPDILMIGEIRDAETAEIAMRAALTGHLVLSTLHTNSATGAFTRLVDIGVEPYLTASTVIATIAQRLVRSLCGECAGTRTVEPGEATLFQSHGVAPPAVVAEPGGCSACGGTGYKGRMPLMEIFELDEPGREQVRKGTIADLVQDPAGSLLAHGLALVAAQKTALAEVMRVVDAA